MRGLAACRVCDMCGRIFEMFQANAQTRQGTGVLGRLLRLSEVSQPGWCSGAKGSKRLCRRLQRA